jgi:hypothetical protein
MIDMDKQYQTRSGRPVRILATDRQGYFPVIGLVQDTDGDEHMETWTIEGNVDFEKHAHDLVEIPEKRTGVVVWSRDGMTQFYFLNENQWNIFKHDPANLFPGAKAVKVVEIEEGEGL